MSVPVNRLVQAEDLYRYQRLFDPQISPDGQNLVSQFRQKDPDVIERENDPRQKELGVVDSELLLFPEEPHGLSRNGRTDRRIVRLNHILRWFNRYL